MRPLVVALALVALLVSPPAYAQRATVDWVPAPGGVDLLRPAFWEGLPSATVADGVVRVSAAEDASLPTISRYGPRLSMGGDFRLQASLQSATSDLALLSLTDIVPEEHWWAGMRRLELGFDQGRVVVGVFDGRGSDPLRWDTVDLANPGGPVTLQASRVAGTVTVEASGQVVSQFPDPGLFPSGRAQLGLRVAPGNELTVHRLAVQAPREREVEARVERCAPGRLLFSASDANDVNTSMWWLWPDDPTSQPRQVEASVRQPSFLVSTSPDGRWAAYYQRSARGPSDRFIVDSWVINLTTDERHLIVEENAPFGWSLDSGAIVLRERPYLMARVPSGELADVDGPMAGGDAMQGVNSPDGKYRSVVSTTGRGAANGVDVYDVERSELLMNVPAGRAAIMMAWSPDSTRLAFTSASDGPQSLQWRLRILDVAERKVSAPASIQDMQIHAVVWTAPLPGCG